mgnify:CR=1 FL=1
MPKTVKYIGTVTRWPELATTGKQSTWVPGQQEQRSDTEAAQLLATGLFSDVDATQLPEQKVVAISGVVSGAGKSASQCVRSGRSAVGWSLTNNSGATGSMALTASGSPFGWPALKVTIPNDTGNVDIIAAGLGLDEFTAGRGNLVIHVYVEDELGIKQIRPYVGNDGGFTRNMDFAYSLSNNSHQRANGHHIIHINPDNATANTLLTTDPVDSVRLRISGQPAGGVVWIEGIYVPDPVQPWMVVTVDDADLSMYERFHRELAARGLMGTFAINWDDVGTNSALFCSQAQLQEMYDYGHDMSSHNRTNTSYAATTPPTAQPSDADRLTYATAYRYTRGVMRSLRWTRALGYHPFVQGLHDGALVAAMQAHGMVLGRGVGPGNVEPFRLDCQQVIRQRQLGSGYSLATAQGWVNSAVARSQDVVLMGHVLANTATNTVTWAQTDFAALIEYALAAGMRVGSVSQWAAARGVWV